MDSAAPTSNPKHYPVLQTSLSPLPPLPSTRVFFLLALDGRDRRAGVGKDRGDVATTQILTVTMHSHWRAYKGDGFRLEGKKMDFRRLMCHGNIGAVFGSRYATDTSQPCPPRAPTITGESGRNVRVVIGAAGVAASRSCGKRRGAGRLCQEGQARRCVAQRQSSRAFAPADTPAPTHACCSRRIDHRNHSQRMLCCRRRGGGTTQPSTSALASWSREWVSAGPWPLTASLHRCS